MQCRSAVLFFLSGCFLIFSESSSTSDTGSFVGMFKMLLTEKELIRNLNEYVEQLKDKVKTLNLISSQLRLKHDKFNMDSEKYLSNPINSYSLIRRTHADWRYVEKYMEAPVAQIQINILKNLLTETPTEDDLKKSRIGLYSLQKTYRLNAADIAKGLFNGEQFDSKLSPLDSFDMGQFYFDLEDFQHSLDWLYVALEQLNSYHTKMYNILGMDLSSIWTVIAKDKLNQNKIEEMSKAIKIALFHKPKNPAAKRILIDIKESQQNHKACRGEYTQRNKFHCRYAHGNSDFLKLAPLKMEQLLDKPYVVVYHDVIYDSEIQELKQQINPELVRGRVGNGEIDDGRTASASNIQQNATLTMQRISRRITDITGFDIQDPIGIHIANYGLGGHYYNHVDYYEIIPKEVEALGNRIATILFYMNNVAQGGATVFPILERFNFPQKGSAIIWHHLDNAGNGDVRTLHAACPILFGTKWVAIKNIHVIPQMFRKLCLAQ